MPSAGSTQYIYIFFIFFFGITPRVRVFHFCLAAIYERFVNFGFHDTRLFASFPCISVLFQFDLGPDRGLLADGGPWPRTTQKHINHAASAGPDS